MSAVREGRVAIPTGIAVRTVVLPVVFNAAYPRLRIEIEDCKPDIVIAFGLAGGRSAIEFERVALNCMDADIPDNEGSQPRDQVIDEAAPSAYFATLPIRRLANAVTAAVIPSRISNTAGLFVCNRLLFDLLHESKGLAVRAGFVHVPFLPQQTDGVSMSLPTMMTALEVILKEIAISY